MLDLNALADWTVKYIDTHLSATLSVKVIAGAKGADPSDLERAFRRVKGVTIKSYIDARLKEVVMDRLRAGDYRAFYRWCKRAFGSPWTALKAQYQTNKKAN
jgi:methylphosphotriester-DNA--protein-cysteine methyltransferase